MTGGEVMSTYVIPAGCMLCARQAGPKITLRFPRLTTSRVRNPYQYYKSREKPVSCTVTHVHNSK